MLIELDALTHASPPPASASFLAPTWSLGPPNDSQQFRTPVQKQSIVLLQIVLLNPFGSDSFFLNSINRPAKLLSCTVITSAPPTSRPILCSISARNTSRLISTSSVIGWLWEKLVCYMFLPAHSTPTYSPKGYLLLCSRTSKPVSTLYLAPFRLRGVLSILFCLRHEYGSVRVRV